jgi:hypothetical protein
MTAVWEGSASDDCLCAAIISDGCAGEMTVDGVNHVVPRPAVDYIPCLLFLWLYTRTMLIKMVSQLD